MITEWHKQRSIETAERVRKWSADYVGGMTHREIAERDGYDRGYVCDRINKRAQGVPLVSEAEDKRKRGLNSGRPAVWPDCPPELKADYRRFRHSYRIPAAEARAMLEGAS